MKYNLDVQNFKRRNALSLKCFYRHCNNKNFQQILKYLCVCKDFDKPDGFYYNKKTSTLYIFEHFEIDSSNRDDKGSSQLRKSSNQVNKQINDELSKSTSDKYYSEKIVEQGYFEMHGDIKTYYIGEHSEDYRNNYIKTFQRLFKTHSDNITSYIEHCKASISGTPNTIITTFIIEDITMAGTHYKNKKNQGDIVDLLNTKQFFKSFAESSVDFVIFAMKDSHFISMCDKSNFNSNTLIDLLTREFYVFPSMPKLTFAKKLKF